MSEKEEILSKDQQHGRNDETDEHKSKEDFNDSEGVFDSKGKLISFIKYNKVTSYLLSTKYFENLMNWAYDKMDPENEGGIGPDKMYSGLLSIHLKIAMYAGPAACRPASKETVDHIFRKCDTDNSGKIERGEFRTVIVILCSHILTRVLIQWAMTIFFMPFLSRRFLDSVVHEFNKSPLFEFIINLSSDTVKKYSYTVCLAIVRSLLTMFALPWALDVIDNFYDKAADASATENLVLEEIQKRRKSTTEDGKKTD